MRHKESELSSCRDSIGESSSQSIVIEGVVAVISGSSSVGDSEQEGHIISSVRLCGGYIEALEGSSIQLKRRSI